MNFTFEHERDDHALAPISVGDFLERAAFGAAFSSHRYFADRHLPLGRLPKFAPQRQSIRIVVNRRHMRLRLLVDAGLLQLGR